MTEIRLPQSDFVFVYGALRSGTTVFRLMLDHHPQIANPGELDFLFDHLSEDPAAPTGWRYDLERLLLDRIFLSRKLTIPVGVDGLDLLGEFLRQIAARCGEKPVMTLNVHRHVDRILQIFPKARLLHMLRDPRDVARSSIQMGWVGTLYSGVRHWVETETDWDTGTAGIDPAQVFTLSYEDLFTDTEANLRAVCDFLGVPWDAGMLEYHRHSSYPPPDPTLIMQWRQKCTARDIALLEGKAGALMEARGYERNGEPLHPGPQQRLELLAQDKLFIWNFRMKRYGISLFLAEKLLRRTGPKALYRKLKLQMNRIDTLHLR